MIETPYNIRILCAKNDLRRMMQTIGNKYDLPGAVLDLLLSEVLADERQAHLALIAEQFAQAVEKKGDEDGNT